MTVQKLKLPIELFGVESGPGWGGLVTALEEVRKLYNKGKPKEKHIVVLQIKEKFGGLRYYTSAAPHWFLDIVDAVEEASFRVCEECGERGELRGGGWLKTLCGDCAEKKGYELTEVEKELKKHGMKLSDAAYYSTAASVAAGVSHNGSASGFEPEGDGSIPSTSAIKEDV